LQKRRRMLIQLSLWMLFPLLLYFGLKNSPVDGLFHAPTGHFYMVSVVAFLALALSVMVGVIAARQRNIKISFLSLSYISLAALFVLHGLSTPGFLHSHSAVSGNTAQLSILLAVTWLWLSSLSSDRPLIKWLTKHYRLLLPGWALILLLLCILLWSVPGIIQSLQLKDTTMRWALTLYVVAVTGWTMYRYFQTYLNAQFPLQLAIVYSAGWMIAAQIIIVTGTAWALSWWLYHFLLLGSVIVMVVGVLKQYSIMGLKLSSMRTLLRSNPHDLIASYMSSSVRQLVMATEERDSYTAGHNYRVALYSLMLGQQMGLPYDGLKAIAQGGIIHDVGKLRIPDTILNKPGKLTAEERAIIETHPVSGYDLCKRLGFMPEELAIIRSHHERWDGGGYPDRLSGEAIPLLARITAVADVYDALTSSRSYRKAMSHEEAMRLIIKESGSYFDPQCVSAWVELVDEKREFIQHTAQINAKLVLQ